MSLLDTIEDYSTDGLTASVTIREDNLFCEAEGVPAWLGIEYMGQAIAAFAGVCARENNEPVKIGFLVSARRFESPCSHFSIGTTLQVKVQQITDNINGLQVFDCKISARNILIQANLNVFMPENVAQFLKDSSNE